MRDVFFLLQDDEVLLDGDVYVQQVGDGPLTLHVPSRSQVRSETIVQGAWAIVRVQCEKIIDIAPENETLVDPVDGAPVKEIGNVAIGGRLVPCRRRVSQRGTRATGHRLAIGSLGGVPRGCVAIDHLSVLKLALEIRCDEIPTAH
eukprot:4298352-Pleurochrysis_carterae.AAC.1